VAKGFQSHCDTNIYSPVARLSTIRLFLCYALQNNLSIKQLDIPTAFLNGELNTEVYIKPPEGLNIKGSKVLKLNKALYGLKEAPICWNKQFNKFMKKLNFKKSQHDFCL
jgi:hypothetical protein